MYNEISIIINELMDSVKPAIHDKQSQPQLIATVRAWFRVQQQNYTTNPQLYSIARQLALILAKHIPLYDSPEKQLQGAFTLLFPRSTVSIPPELKLSQEAFLRGEFLVLGENSILIEDLPTNPDLPVLHSLEKLPDLIETIKEGIDAPENEQSLHARARKRSAEYLLAILEKNDPITLDKIPGILQSLPYRQSKTGFTADPYAPINILCVQLAWLSIDKTAPDPLKQFWKCLYPDLDRVIDGKANTQWPHYGEALIDGNTVINYRELLFNNNPEILNQFSEALKGRIRRFNPVHADVWCKVKITLKPYNNYYSFFLELKDILYKYRAGHNNSQEDFIGEEGIKEIEPTLKPLAEFLTYVYCLDEAHELRKACKKTVLSTTLLQCIANLTAPGTSTASCFNRNHSALDNILSDSEIKTILSDPKYFSSKAFDGSHNLQAHGHEELPYFDEHLSDELISTNQDALADEIKAIKRENISDRAILLAYKKTEIISERSRIENFFNFLYKLGGENEKLIIDYFEKFKDIENYDERELEIFDLEIKFPSYIENIIIYALKITEVGYSSEVVQRIIDLLADFMEKLGRSRVLTDQSKINYIFTILYIESIYKDLQDRNISSTKLLYAVAYTLNPNERCFFYTLTSLLIQRADAIAYENIAKVYELITMGVAIFRNICNLYPEEMLNKLLKDGRYQELSYFIAERHDSLSPVFLKEAIPHCKDHLMNLLTNSNFQTILNYFSDEDMDKLIDGNFTNISKMSDESKIEIFLNVINRQSANFNENELKSHLANHLSLLTHFTRSASLFQSFVRKILDTSNDIIFSRVLREYIGGIAIKHISDLTSIGNVLDWKYAFRINEFHFDEFNEKVKSILNNGLIQQTDATELNTDIDFLLPLIAFENMNKLINIRLDTRTFKKIANKFSEESLSELADTNQMDLLVFFHVYRDNYTSSLIEKLNVYIIENADAIVGSKGHYMSLEIAEKFKPAAPSLVKAIISSQDWNKDTVPPLRAAAIRALKASLIAPGSDFSESANYFNELFLHLLKIDCFSSDFVDLIDDLTPLRQKPRYPESENALNHLFKWINLALMNYTAHNNIRALITYACAFNRNQYPLNIPLRMILTAEAFSEGIPNLQLSLSFDDFCYAANRNGGLMEFGVNATFSRIICNGLDRNHLKTIITSENWGALIFFMRHSEERVNLISLFSPEELQSITPESLAALNRIDYYYGDFQSKKNSELDRELQNLLKASAESHNYTDFKCDFLPRTLDQRIKEEIKKSFWQMTQHAHMEKSLFLFEPLVDFFHEKKDDPGFIITQPLMNFMFKSHPYTLPRFLKIVELLRREQLSTTFRLYFGGADPRVTPTYVPDNCIVPNDSESTFYRQALRLACIPNDDARLRAVYKACFEQNPFSVSNATGSTVFFSRSLDLRNLNRYPGYEDTRISRIVRALQRL